MLPLTVHAVQTALAILLLPPSFHETESDRSVLMKRLFGPAAASKFP